MTEALLAQPASACTWVDSALVVTHVATRRLHRSAAAGPIDLGRQDLLPGRRSSPPNREYHMLPRVHDEVPPDGVPGFYAARRSGVVKEVPGSQPQRVRGASARERFHLWVVVMVVSLALLVLAVRVLAQLIPETSPMRLLIAVPGLVWFFAALRGLHLVGDRSYEEFAAGYTTLRLAFGGFRIGRWRRWAHIDHRTPWDYRGLWVLDGKGTVVKTPDRSVLPPGFYPSPTRPGQLELWTGRVWMGEFRRTPVF